MANSKSTSRSRKANPPSEASFSSNSDSPVSKHTVLAPQQGKPASSSSSNASSSVSDETQGATYEDSDDEVASGQDKAEDDEAEATEDQGTKGPAEFDDWYLREITKECADDLDKLRSAPDFTEESLPMLIGLLKQCSSTYSDEQKRLVMNQDKLKGLKWSS